MRVGERFRADVSYDYLWTRDDLNERPLGGRPPHTVTAALRGTLGWKIEGNVRFSNADDFCFVDIRRVHPIVGARETG